MTKIVGQVVGGAGKVLNEALLSSSRHSRAGGNPTPSDALDPGFRRGDGAVADGKNITLSDAAIAANRRTADALKRRTTVGDLLIFTVDAINTDGEKAVQEVADLIGQVHERSPDQAKELLEATLQNVAHTRRQHDSAGATHCLFVLSSPRPRVCARDRLRPGSRRTGDAGFRLSPE